MSPSAATDEKSVAGCKVEDCREVGKVAGPVGPGGDEAGEISESAFAPDVESTFTGIARGEFQHRQRKRRVKSEPGADPDQDRAGTSGGSGGDPAQADAGDNVEQDEVAEPHRFLGPLRIFSLGYRDARAEKAYSFR